jgi:hypothetical protein
MWRSTPNVPLFKKTEIHFLIKMSHFCTFFYGEKKRLFAFFGGEKMAGFFRVRHNGQFHKFKCADTIAKN